MTVLGSNAKFNKESVIPLPPHYNKNKHSFLFYVCSSELCLYCTKLGIPIKNHKYQYGKNDLFAVVISLRYVLSKEDFLSFKHQLASLIDTLVKNTCLTESEILSAMGFPINWKKITAYTKLS